MMYLFCCPCSRLLKIVGPFDASIDFCFNCFLNDSLRHACFSIPLKSKDEAFPYLCKGEKWYSNSPILLLHILGKERIMPARELGLLTDWVFAGLDLVDPIRSVYKRDLLK